MRRCLRASCASSLACSFAKNSIQPCTSITSCCPATHTLARFLLADSVFFGVVLPPVAHNVFRVRCGVNRFGFFEMPVQWFGLVERQRSMWR